MEKPCSYPCRLVVHSLPEGRSHIDVFVDPGKNEPLVTFELPISWLERFDCNERGGGEEKFKVVINALKTTPAGGDPLDPKGPIYRIPACRKEDHRPLYMHHTGAIGNDRGVIRQLADGTFEGDPWSATILEVRLEPTF